MSPTLIEATTDQEELNSTTLSPKATTAANTLSNFKNIISVPGKLINDSHINRKQATSS